MPKVIAKAEIHRTIKPGKAATATSPAVRPEIEIIAPGTAFISEGEELKALRASRAIRDPEGTETASPSEAAVDGSDDTTAPKTGSKPKTSTKTNSKPKTSKPKNEPAASTDKTSTEGADAGNGGENDSDDDNGAGDGNEGDDDANLV